ncbi:MAG: hypothetical protein JKZ00_05410 [Flavobacteriaceae bacterium]|nr:hypothetical protein [Flavobacteriaceae bacterium]
MYQEHRNIKSEKADFDIESSVFGNEYTTDTKKATEKYIDKTIQLSGEVTEIESDSFTLDNLVVCYTDSATLKKIVLNTILLVKGRSIGYDELLGLVKLDQVSIVND